MSKMKRLLESAWQAGADARLLGLTHLNNPYAGSNEPKLFDEWMAGWKTEDEALRQGHEPGDDPDGDDYADRAEWKYRL